MHARDYGFLAANPFGRNAFGKGELGKVVVQPGESLRLQYSVLLHSAVGAVVGGVALCSLSDSIGQSRAMGSAFRCNRSYITQRTGNNIRLTPDTVERGLDEE